MTIELSEYVIDAIADAVVKKMQEPSYNSVKTELELVSRQTVLDGLASIAKVKAKSDAQKSLMGRVIFFVEQVPSVTPQQKAWRWIMSDDGLYRPICNNCGAHPWKGYIPTVEEATEVFKYCPNCGAKMSEIPTGAEGSDQG